MARHTDTLKKVTIYDVVTNIKTALLTTKKTESIKFRVAQYEITLTADEFQELDDMFHGMRVP